MLRRILVAAQHRPSTTPAVRMPLQAARRRCATQAAEKEAAQSASQASSSSAAGGRAATDAVTSKAAAAQGGAKATGRTLPHGPQRKDWRTHKDIVYVKGVPAKGNMFKLPWSQQFIIYLVFSLAGSGAVLLVRPQIRYLCHHGFLGLTDEAGWANGPWLYRLLYVLIMFPSYSLILFMVGAVFGRRIWFSFMIHKMWSRFLTKKASQRFAYLLDIQHY